jgi:GNAT superfamily N-acetyltransferase
MTVKHEDLVTNPEMIILVKSPNECSSAELDVFERMVLEGDEVSAAGLRQRIMRAEKLVFIIETECIAVGAIKNPESEYKLRVFKNAGIPEKQGKFEYELGWLYVSPLERGKGYGNCLMQAITDLLDDTGCFATTRADNNSMHQLFSKYSFTKLGVDYPNDKNQYLLTLYGYKV